MNGSDAETTGGDGGELDIAAEGLVQVLDVRSSIQANGGTLFDGSGGAIAFSSGDSFPNVLG